MIQNPIRIERLGVFEAENDAGRCLETELDPAYDKDRSRIWKI